MRGISKLVILDEIMHRVKLVDSGDDHLRQSLRSWVCSM
jgi:hypothetical protein